jgi:hypothetical protein
LPALVKTTIFYADVEDFATNAGAVLAFTKDVALGNENQWDATWARLQTLSPPSSRRDDIRVMGHADAGLDHRLPGRRRAAACGRSCGMIWLLSPGCVPG